MTKNDDKIIILDKFDFILNIYFCNDDQIGGTID